MYRKTKDASEVALVNIFRMPQASENVELEVLGVEDNDKPSSAPVISQEVQKRSLSRKSTSHRRKKRSQTKSCTSLQNIAGILKHSTSDLHSEPYLYSSNKNETEDYNEISFNMSQNSSKNNLDPSNDADLSQFQGLESEGSYHENVREPTGSFSTQTSTIGFRASFFSVLEKLGVWRNVEQPPMQDRTFDNDPPNRHSITSIFFHSLYGGNFK